MALALVVQCLDIMDNLESCGGCPDEAESVDCTTILGVDSARCQSGKCQGELRVSESISEAIQVRIG
jgi:hypothetical protein